MEITGYLPGKDPAGKGIVPAGVCSEVIISV